MFYEAAKFGENPETGFFLSEGVKKNINCVLMVPTKADGDGLP
jgi:hypothetical protein